MITDPKYLLIFGKVAECGGITAAARVLGIPKASVSRAVKYVESTLSTRLIERSARKIRLTEAGATLLQHCSRISEELENAEASIGALQGNVKGRVKIATPFPFGHIVLAPLLPEFLARFPDVQVELELTNRRVDPTAENFDLVVRLGAVTESALIGRTLGGSVPCGLFASPDYVKKNARLRHPRDLERHPLITGPSESERQEWVFTKGGDRVSVPLTSARFKVNDMLVRIDAAIAGVGIALVPIWVANSASFKKTLRRLLPNWTSPLDSEIHILYPTRGSLNARSRALISFLEERVWKKTPPKSLGRGYPLL